MKNDENGCPLDREFGEIKSGYDYLGNNTSCQYDYTHR